jgi:phosphatidylinositol-3-phosphatase
MFKNALLLGSMSAALGCGANTSGNTSTTCQDLSTAAVAPAPNPAWSGTVFTIVMENHSASEILGNSAAPFINQLAKDNAVAQGYHDSFVHPSEPNYIWMVAGQNFGVLDDNDPDSHHLASKSHLADQLELAGISWKTYQESMGDACGLVSHGRYAAKHNPFVYFDDINGWDGTTFQPSPRCNEHVVDYTQFDADLAANTLPRYAFITPNLDNDMHDGSIQQGDKWLEAEVGKILASDAFNNGGVLFLLWDEGGGTFGASDDPPFIAISPHAKPGYVSNTDYDTSSYLLTVQSLFGLQTLPCAETSAAATVSAMTDLFDVPLTQQ